MSLDNNLEESVASVPSCEDVACAAASPRYITSELMAELISEQTDPFTWIAILARLEGSGLLVPPQDEVAFMFAYQRMLKTLFGEGRLRRADDIQQLIDLYLVLPLSYVSAEACNLLQGVSYGIEASLAYDDAKDLIQPFLPRYRDDPISYEDVERIARGIEPLFYKNNIKQKIKNGKRIHHNQYGEFEVGALEWSKLYQTFSNLGAVERRCFVTSLLQQHDLEQIVTLLEDDLKYSCYDGNTVIYSWNYNSQWIITDDILNLILNDWQSQLRYCYQSGVLNGATSSNLILRFENYLWYRVNHPSVLEDSYDTTAANKLYHMLPGSIVEQRMLDLARSSFVVTVDENGSASINLCDSYSFNEFIYQLYTFFPEWRGKLCDVRYNLDLTTNTVDKNIKQCYWFIPLLPPKFWFEVLQIKLTGNKEYDAQQLFKVFANFTLNDSGYLSYFITRIKFELGDEYLAAFCKYCSSHLSDKFVRYFLAKLKYDEREEMPWVYDSTRYPVEITPKYEPLNYLLNWIDQLYSQPCKHWGPKFSRYFCTKLLIPYAISNLKDIGRIRLDAYPHNHNAQSQLRALALSVDPTVKLELTQPINEIITTFVQEKDRQAELVESLEDKTEPDELVQRQFCTQQMEFCDNAIYSLNLLLDYFAWAEHIDSMCAQAIAQPV